MNAKTISTRISKLTVEDVNDVIDAINGKDVELSSAAKLAYRAIADDPYSYVDALDERWENAQDERATTFESGTTVEFDIPKDRMRCAAEPYGIYYRGNGWAPGSKLVTFTGTVVKYSAFHHRLHILCGNEQWNVSPSLVRRAS